MKDALTDVAALQVKHIIRQGQRTGQAGTWESYVQDPFGGFMVYLAISVIKENGEKKEKQKAQGGTAEYLEFKS